MILVIIIVVAWVVILGPNLLKRRARTVGGISSISHFHRQLRVLEHSAPQPLVTPAYRLRAVDGSGIALQGPDGSQVQMAPKLSVVGADRLPRPALAFLGEDPVGPGADAIERVDTGPRATFDPSGLAVPESTRPSDADARAVARRRRRDTLGVLVAVFVTTLMIGFIPGATAAWLVTLVSGVALIAYVALLVRMRQMAEERERKLHYLRPAARVGEDARHGLTDLPVRISGRYAHPSHQAAAAH